MRRVFPLFAVALACLPLLAAPEPKALPADLVVFDFEDSAALDAWSNLELPDARAKEPPARIELSTEHATWGKHSLKITFAGGRWPTVTTTAVHADWMPYW